MKIEKLTLHAVVREDKLGFEVLHCGTDTKHCDSVYDVLKHCSQPKERIVYRIVLKVKTVEEQVVETVLQFPEEKRK